MTAAEITRQREKLAKCLTVARDLTGKFEQLIDEMDALLGGKAGIGETLRQMEAAFDAAWSTRYSAGESGRYVWSYVKDRAQMKRLIREVGIEDLPRRFIAYISDEDKFLTAQRHPFGLLTHNVNKYARSTGHAFELASEATGCTHTPKCSSEQACTKRGMREMRG